MRCQVCSGEVLRLLVWTGLMHCGRGQTGECRGLESLIPGRFTLPERLVQCLRRGVYGANNVTLANAVLLHEPYPNAGRCTYRRARAPGTTSMARRCMRPAQRRRCLRRWSACRCWWPRAPCCRSPTTPRTSSGCTMSPRAASGARPLDVDACFSSTYICGVVVVGFLRLCLNATMCLSCSQSSFDVP